MDRCRIIRLQVVLIGFLIAGFACGGEQKLISLNSVPKDKIRIILGPWANESQVPPDRRKGYDLINIKVEASGELSMHLPEYAFGTAWCYITAPGFEPAFLSGDVPKIEDDLKQYRNMKLRSLSSAENGVIAGVTYIDKQGRGVNHPVTMVVKNAKLTFDGEKKRSYQCASNAEGFYMVILPAGKYKIKTGYSAYEGARPDVREFGEPGGIEVKRGQTTIQDLVLSTLHVD